MLKLFVVISNLAVIATDKRDFGNRNERGQATAEYVLVMLGAAAVALLVVAWATKTNKVTTLLNKVVDALISRVS